MINANTGLLELPFDKIIIPGMSLDEIKNLDIGESQDESNLGNGWVWYNVSNIRSANLYFMISFGLYHNRLVLLSLVFSNRKYEQGKGWESWNENEERLKNVTFNNWLKSELGSERVFGWGEVWADFDFKSGGSSIKIRYNS